MIEAYLSLCVCVLLPSMTEAYYRPTPRYCLA
jgi:hypothetical protein